MATDFSGFLQYYGYSGSTDTRIDESSPYGGLVSNTTGPVTDGTLSLLTPLSSMTVTTLDGSTKLISGSIFRLSAFSYFAWDSYVDWPETNPYASILYRSLKLTISNLK